MFRLPVCPHCGTVYRYRDVMDALRKKKNTCYHCQKPFYASPFPYVWIEAAVLAALCIGTNILILTRMQSLSLISLFVVTLVFLLFIYLLMPFFSVFRKDDPINHHINKKQTSKKTKK